MMELRCSRCAKLLAKIETKVTIEIKCTRCGRMNNWSASSVQSECPSSTPLEELRDRYIHQTHL